LHLGLYVMLNRNSLAVLLVSEPLVLLKERGIALGTRFSVQEIISVFQ